MIRVRTWTWLAATVIAFAVAFVYWEGHAPSSNSASPVVGWDLSEIGPSAHDSWFLAGEICSAIFVASLLLDVWTGYRRRK